MQNDFYCESWKEQKNWICFLKYLSQQKLLALSIDKKKKKKDNWNSRRCRVASSHVVKHWETNYLFKNSNQFVIVRIAVERRNANSILFDSIKLVFIWLKSFKFSGISSTMRVLDISVPQMAKSFLYFLHPSCVQNSRVKIFEKYLQFGSIWLNICAV